MEKIFIKTFGCSLNLSDSEVMAGLLEKRGYDIVQNEEDAELVIINTCTVKGPTESNFHKYLESLENKKIIIAGCIAQTAPETLGGYSLIGTSQLSQIAEVVEETLNDNIVTLLVEEKNPRLNLPKIRKNNFVEILPICSGCLGSCTYCKVRQARGQLFSYLPEAIEKQFVDAITDGVKEVWITSQDNGAYGKDIGTNIIELLKRLLKHQGEYQIRLGMINPNFVLEYLDELVELFKDKHMYKFLHAPVQSGNDEILRLMKRKYDVEGFKKIIKTFRENIPEITIATDVIVGFPTEDNLQFNDTITLIRNTHPAVINRSRYWIRSGTEAAEMQQVDTTTSKNRMKILTDLVERTSTLENERWLDWTGKVLITEKNEHGLVGRNYCYKPVVLQGEHKIGNRLKVKVKKAAIWHLVGEAL